ncbi:MAG: hypothetical protein IJ617_01890 [Oscillospiraceae bacterium]|nr:hypothetical protein [Oscillospiraceae bacterium]
MDGNNEKLLSLCRDPMIVVEDGKLAFMNPAARAAFPHVGEGRPAAKLFSPHFLREEGGSYTARAAIAGRNYSVFCDTEGALRMFSLVPEPEEENGPSFLSDGCLVQMNATLGVISLALDRLAAHTEAAAGDDTLRMTISVLRKQYHFIKRQVGNLSTMKLLREKRLRYVPEPTNLTALCADLVDSASTLLGDGCASLRFSSPLETMIADVDADLIERLLLNLIDNSLAHTPKGGQIHLHLDYEDENVVITVEDSGSGIPMDVYPSIFCRYACGADRNHIDRAATAGLGLAIADGIARLHGGVLLVRTQVGRGTKVRLKLPYHLPSKVEISRSPIPPHPHGLDPVLTELSDILGFHAYALNLSD